MNPTGRRRHESFSRNNLDKVVERRAPQALSVRHFGTDDDGTFSWQYGTNTTSRFERRTRMSSDRWAFIP